MKEPFDYEKFKVLTRKQLQSGKNLLGKNGVFTPLLKDFLEESLEGELDAHLAKERPKPNKRNGKGKKRIKTSPEPVDLHPPRDRDSSFEPAIIPTRQLHLGKGLDHQILALYARGSSYSDIRNHLLDMYGVETSTATISRVTDKILPLLQE